MDFDDVLNIFSSRNAYRSKKGAFGYLARSSPYIDGHSYDINWSKELARKLMDAKSKYGFDWLWLTIWKSNTVKYVDPLMGIKSDGYIDWDADSGIDWRTPTDVIDDIRDTRKYAILLSKLKDNPMPFIWIDDSATRKYNKADFVGVLDVPHIIIRPAVDFGMLKDDLDTMLNFLDSISKK